MIKYNSRQNSIVPNNNGILLKPSTTKPCLVLRYFVSISLPVIRNSKGSLAIENCHFYLNEYCISLSHLIFASLLWLFSDSQSVWIIIINYNFVLKKFIIREKLNNFQFNQNFVDIEQVIKVKWYMYIIYTRLAVQTKLLFMNITRFDSLVTNMIISSSYHWYD